MTSRNVLNKLECPNCGAPIEQFTPGAQTIVCNTCGSYVAVGGEVPNVVGKSRKLSTPPAPINIGDKFTLQDTEYFVLGRVEYYGWDPNDRSDTWRWNEWLLGAKDGRLLWLSHDEKGFTLYTKMRLRAPFDPLSSSAIPVGKGKSARVHERYPAEIIGAEGELTWRAEQGEQLNMIEAAASGKRYSVQHSAEELEVYEGDPVDAREIAQAFNDEAWLKRLDRKANNITLMGIISVICIFFAAVALVLAAVNNSSGQVVTRESIQVSTQSTTAQFPVEFNQSGRPAIVSMRTPMTLPQNTSFDIEVNITSPNETKTYLFTKEFWHETGVDEDGPWTDTKYSLSDMFVPTETGSHTLEFVLDGAVGVDNIPLEVSIKRNHVFPMWYVVYGVCIGGIGLALMFSAASMAGLIKSE